MIPTLDSVTAEFFAFRQAFFAAGGHRKAVKYPSNLRAAAVALLRATPDFNIGPIAKSLGIGYGALREWHAKSPVRPVQSAVARQSFIPVKILADPAPNNGPLPASAGLVVTYRETTVHLGCATDPALLASVIASLRMIPGGAHA